MRSVLKGRNFRLLWGGQAVSQVGDAFCSISALFTVMDMTGNSAMAIAGITACNQVPSLLVGLWSGVFIDRWDYRRTMIASDLARMLLSLCLVVFAALRWLPGIYSTMVLMGAAAQFFNPSRAALIPDIVDEKDLLSANSLSQTTFMMITTMGAAVGAALFAVLGNRFCFAFNAATFAVSALTIASITATKRRGPSRETRASLVSEFTQGYRYIGERPHLAALFAGLFFTVLGFGAINVLGPKFVTDVLKLAKEYYAVHSLFVGAGAALASVFVAGLSSRIKPVTIFSSSLLLIGSCLVAISVPTSLFVLALVVFLIGVGNVCMNIGLSTIMQSQVSKEYRGRVFGLISPLATTGTLLSAGLGASLSGHVGLRPVFALAGGLVILAGVFVGSRLRDLPRAGVNSQAA